MHVTELDIPGVRLLQPQVFEDLRGHLYEPYNYRTLAEAGIDIDFVQDIQSLSRHKGTVRGLHFQVPPAAQAKLVRVAHGAVLDVAVDLRRGSPFYGRHVAVELSAANKLQLLVPIGFAHGFCTLAPDTLFLYKTSAYYSPEHDRGVLWNDPDLGIPWPVTVRDAILSERDRNQPRLCDLPSYFGM